MASSKDTMVKLGMRVFGLPYQFPAQVDPRFSDLTSTVGRSYLNNIRLQAPILTIIPGNPYYLPGEDKGVRVSMGQQIIDNADTNTFKWLKKNTVNNKDLKSKKEMLDLGFKSILIRPLNKKDLMDFFNLT